MRDTPIAEGHVGAFARDQSNLMRVFLNFQHPEILDLKIDPKCMQVVCAHSPVSAPFPPSSYLPPFVFPLSCYRCGGPCAGVR